MSDLLSYQVSFWYRGNGHRGHYEVKAATPREAVENAIARFDPPKGETMSDMLAIVYEGKRAAGMKFHFVGIRVEDGGGPWSR